MWLAALLLSTWIATWGTAPGSADQGRSFENVTLREVVHISIGGSRVRVRFTNRFSDAPLVIGRARVAIEASGAAPVAGTGRALTFQGNEAITIPPHADAYSDGVSLDVPPQSNLLIDMYVPGPTAPATMHELAYQTNYYAQGDRTGSSAASLFPYTFSSWYYLAAVDVDGSHARGSLVALGDSITDGAGGKTNANDRWPDFLGRRLLQLTPAQQMGIVNAGISGNRILLSAPAFGIDALARLDSDVLAQSAARDVVVFLGVNDIQQMPHQYDAAAIEQGLAQIAQQSHAAGLRVIGCTITPYEGWFTYEPAGEAARQAVNTFIRTSRVFDAAVDFDRAVRDPNDVHRLAPALDSGDHLHPNAAGHRAMAEAFTLQYL